jgi:hypothetical protein
VDGAEMTQDEFESLHFLAQARMTVPAILEQQLAEAQSVAKHEADCAEAYKAEADELRKQLAAKDADIATRDKHIVMLRNALDQIADDDYDGSPVPIARKALAATDDLSGCILCDAEPVTMTYTTEPLYRARTK